MIDHPIASREEWQAARDELQQREKEHTRLGDELAQQRRELPWVPIEKEYAFATEDGTKTLAELFDGRSQLFVYHFMFGPSYEAGCPVCSSGADTVNGVLDHLRARDVTVLYVSRAPLERILEYKERMGWRFPWVSSAESDFNFDFGVSHTDEEVHEQLGPMLGDPPPVVQQLATATGTDVAGYLSEEPGSNVFALADGTVYRAYSVYERGLEFLMGFYPILDRVPKGRDEDGESEFWLRRHDEYDA